MEINKTKYYNTYRLKSVLFYVAILLPVLIILLTVVTLRYSKDYRDVLPLLFFYVFVLPMEAAAIKYWKAKITIDENGITIKNGNKLSKAKWIEIEGLETLLFNWGGELSYQLITKDKKIMGFGDSIDNCTDLLKEIESHTGLTFKKRL